MPVRAKQKFAVRAADMAFSVGEKARKGVASGVNSGMKLAIGGGSSAVVGGIMAGTASILSVGAGAAAIGTGSLFDIYFNHREYKHKETQLLYRFEEELIALKGEATPETLKALAEDNPVLKEEMRRNRLNRKFSNIGSVIAGVSTFIGIGLISVTAGLPLLATAAVGAVVGLVGSKAIKFATEKIGQRSAGIHKPSVLEQIDKLGKRPKEITPEKVFGIYVEALPGLAKEIKQAHGKSYEKLDPETRMEVFGEYRKQFHERYNVDFDKITFHIQNGDILLQELVFLTNNQTSGYIPQGSVFERTKAKIQTEVSEVREKVSDKVEDFKEQRAEKKLDKLAGKIEDALEKGKELPKEAREIGDENYWRTVISSGRVPQRSQEGSFSANVMQRQQQAIENRQLVGAGRN